MRLHSLIWTQVAGDMDPGSYGATLARSHGQEIELLKIEPVREYVGTSDAREVGFPFWTKEAYYYPEYLDRKEAHVIEVARYSDLDLDDASPLTIACALLDYGHGEEGESGWAKDIFPSPQRCRWWGAERPSGWQYLADEDREFRQMMRERK